ncbi:hypothetical protein [Desulfotruncus alcoholivorax]|uniref:hypothetical protein n=1 Tax=Desulfotruncus alcoholivorax TaxID=265477 RepID=UPI00146F9646|nr:hypothetical protein [Desulfotruncus alcoholivorax]
MILCGVYIWQGEIVHSTESGTNIESDAIVAEQQENPAVPDNQPVKKPATTPVPATPYYSANPQPSPQADLPEQAFISGTKVGDIIKFGDVEMQVTKAPARHKIIDITLSGNSFDQPPELIRSENNRIMYEIPADVDVHMDVTEKIVFNQ